MKISLSKILPALAIGLCLKQTVLADGTQTWPGTLYRNGGYFGPNNSDDLIEYGLDDASLAPTEDSRKMAGMPAAVSAGQLDRSASSNGLVLRRTGASAGNIGTSYTERPAAKRLDWAFMSR